MMHDVSNLFPPDPIVIDEVVGKVRLNLQLKIPIRRRHVIVVTMLKKKQLLTKYTY